MSFRRIVSVLPPLALAAAMLALGTAVAPGKARPASGHLSLSASSPSLRGSRLHACSHPGTASSGSWSSTPAGVDASRRSTSPARARRRSQLDRDRAHGLQVELRSCPRRWRRRGTVYTCAKSRIVLSRRPLVRRAKLKRLRLAAGRTVHLRLVVTLPSGASGALAGEKTTAVYSFVGTRARRR